MNKQTDGDAVDIIENEGLDYAVRHYISGDYFEHAETGRLWDEAEKALDALVKHLARSTGRTVG